MFKRLTIEKTDTGFRLAPGDAAHDSIFPSGGRHHPFIAVCGH
jgi:hypothetical protein